MPRVTKIPATLAQYTAIPIAAPRKRRVAAYARVSTDHEDQQSSYEAQVDYYTHFIKERADWEFVDIYAEMLTPSLIQMHPTCTQIAP